MPVPAAMPPARSQGPLRARHLRPWLAALATTLLASTSLVAPAQSYPSKPIRLIVPTAPGGGTDALGRALAAGLASALNQSVVIDNKPGANAVIGTEAAARTPPDGYTLLMVVNTHTINPAVVKKLPYDTLKDFAPIASLARSPFVVVSTAATGVKNVKSLVELARTSTGKLQFGSAEAGMRLTAARMRRDLGIEITDIAYKSTGSMISDVAGGHLSFAVTSVASTLPFRGSGKLNYVAVTSRERSAALPEVETLNEQGLPGFEATVWYGLVGPAHMDPDVVALLNRSVRAVMASEDVKSKLAALAMDAWVLGPTEFAGFLANDLAQSLAAARAAGIEPE